MSDDQHSHGEDLVIPIIKLHQTAWLTYEHLANLFEASPVSGKNTETSGLTGFGRYFRLLAHRMRSNQYRWIDYQLMHEGSLISNLCGPTAPLTEAVTVKMPIDAMQMANSLETRLHQLYVEAIRECEQRGNLHDLRSWIELKFLHAQVRMTHSIEAHLARMQSTMSGPPPIGSASADYRFDRLQMQPITEEITFDLICEDLADSHGEGGTIEKLELLAHLAQIHHLRQSPMQINKDAHEFNPLELIY